MPNTIRVKAVVTLDNENGKQVTIEQGIECPPGREKTIVTQFLAAVLQTGAFDKDDKGEAVLYPPNRFFVIRGSHSALSLVSGAEAQDVVNKVKSTLIQG